VAEPYAAKVAYGYPNEKSVGVAACYSGSLHLIGGVTHNRMNEGDCKHAKAKATLRNRPSFSREFTHCHLPSSPISPTGRRHVCRATRGFERIEEASRKALSLSPAEHYAQTDGIFG
jgi:hypothetical protein